MGNLWEFLLQTCSVTLVAALLWAVKALLADHLSPRWQYGVWSVLALRILLPVPASREVLLPVSLWLEMGKAAVERRLDSAYSAIYEVDGLFLPWRTAPPRSVTDWLFVLYAAGVAAVLLWYAIAYLRLRLLLRQGASADAAAVEQIQAVCARYHLRGCRAVKLPNLPSAFVCGVVRPVLVLPADRATDDKVLLHELLHLRYGDALQSAFWCVLKALHWCNPLLYVVFRRIENDREALCDQRVLERLEGEERRDYGGILLSMANDRYPRLPGTTSVSNGGKNIARRITAIVRFKKYPRGMGLVSVCVAVVLAVPVLVGTAAAYPPDAYRPNTGPAFERAMAMVRLRRCTTVAGALDTYAKGLLYDNGIYLAMASPLERHPRLEAQMRYNAEVDGWEAYHLDGGAELEYVSPAEGYCIYNLDRQLDGSYTAQLAFPVTAFLDPQGKGWLGNEAGEAYSSGSVLVTVSLRQEDGWVVEECAPRESFPGVSIYALPSAETGKAGLRRMTKVGRTGTVELRVWTDYILDNTVPSSGWNPFGTAAFDETLKPDADFDWCNEYTSLRYLFGGGETQRSALSSVAMEMESLHTPGEAAVFSDRARNGDTAWSSSDGTGGCSQTVTQDWDGVLMMGGGGTASIEDGLVLLPAGYAVRVYWNGEAVEDFILGEAE